MSTALLSEAAATARQRRTRTLDERWQDLVAATWRRAKAASNPNEARRWLERAHRLLPQDGTLAASLAATLLELGDYHPARALFQSLADRHGIPEAWAGLATCAHRLGDRPAAQEAVAALIRCSVLTPVLRSLGDAVAGPHGWCALDADGRLVTSVPPRSVSMDGAAVGDGRLPAGWRQAGSLAVEGPNGAMLGSPIPLPPFAGIEGFAEARDGGVAGWAWSPTDPAATPAIHARGPLGNRIVHATAAATGLAMDRPLARPRRFALSAAEVALLGEPLSLRGPDGRHVLGSPLEPGLERRAAAGLAGIRFAPVWADVVGTGMAIGRPAPGVDVVVPVYRGAAETVACLDSLRAAIPRGTRLIVVDDASPDPGLRRALDTLARRRQIRLLRLPENAGFPAAANAGVRLAAGRDVVLLNSDTLVPPGWLERLRAAAYAAPDIGTATPLTNNGTIVSYPDPSGGNPMPDLRQTVALDALAQQANAGQVADLPVGVGFCLYVRRDCLDQAGPLREDLFAQGYGEENDFCLRARHHGWRHVAALDVFVGHSGAVSFGAARAHLIQRNAVILERLHPGYDALIAEHVRVNPLLPARARMDARRWAAGRHREGALAIVTHGGGGGVERVVAQRARAAIAAGQRAVVLRPARLPDGPGVRLEEWGGPAYPNLVFPLPAGLPALVKQLRPDRMRAVELHHLLGHHHAIASLAGCLRAEAVSIVHDYARFCGRIALVGREHRYCGEPDVAGCEACLADLGSLLEDEPTVPALLGRSAAELRGAARVVAPSADAAARIARHFPGVVAQVEPWETDALPRPKPAPRGARLRVAIIGAIGREKGFDVLLACTRDAQARTLPLEFVVVGFTADDERLLQAGPAFVTGEYAEADAVALIRAQRAQAAFIPSVWPETWCFTLTRAWQAGLPAFVFDLGAQAERVRGGGHGWVLPLGLSARGVNDALLRLACAGSASQCPAG